MIVIAGPTASGKTALAVELARRLGGEIVSADSRQVYRRLDAGTAKPTRAQRAAVKHWLIDVAEPTETYDAARWANEARKAVAHIRGRGKLPIVCGGTGLYLRALLEGLSPLPPRDETVRARLSAEAEARGREALHARLAAADPEAAKAIPPGNLQRLLRALEVLELTGKPISEHWSAAREGGESAALALTLEVPPEELRRRIEERARAFWPALLAELRALLDGGLDPRAPGLSSLGYREAAACVRGELADAEGLAALLASTFAYAKRQRTWFRGQLAGRSVAAAGEVDLLAANVCRIWEDTREKAGPAL